ncbi:Hemin import ATP-binding protein HmuV [uncultured Roseburia sp.]|uniref:ABC transporter ATP-binding protein n=1 Tax=Brotonthovivens ammoniilytica TaxID=2981725 RepID=A0ABT2THQ0_9FIRM|nr:ABC transporter ATP-binding protein [Brotonthovivens ammoniilytica]MCU6761720.1 ABC transporter ATP-binding protein [Brotonthovivens ammoniilytica]SCI44496.1 Hemin import ATP-binding protein HmuV [uncultured Roseburia sp.]
MSLEVQQLSFRYGKRNIFEKITFSLEEGNMLALLGPNGTGKTTLLKSLCGILRPYEGESRLMGSNLLKMDIKKRAKLVAYVPQNTNNTFPMRVIDAVLMGRKPFQRFGVTKEDEQKAFEILRKMELEDFAFKNINEMSGGERQRVFIARALCQEPELLLLDEPTSSMDLKNQLRTMALVRKLVDEQKLSVIVSIHDINLSAMYCDKFLMLHQGSIFACGSDEEVLKKEHIESVYGVAVAMEVMEDIRHMVLKKI